MLVIFFLRHAVIADQEAFFEAGGFVDIHKIDAFILSASGVHQAVHFFIGRDHPQLAVPVNEIIPVIGRKIEVNMELVSGTVRLHDLHITVYQGVNVYIAYVRDTYRAGAVVGVGGGIPLKVCPGKHQ
ncbi:hypothetical protein D9M69_638180 [compost metagenome]